MYRLDARSLRRLEAESRIAFVVVCILSRQGHLENSPPFQRWVTSSPDEGQAPAGAKEVDDRRSAVCEHPHDRRYRSRDTSMVVASARTNRSAFDTRCEIIRPKIGLSSLRDFTNCCGPNPSNKLLGYFRTSLAGQRPDNGTKPFIARKDFHALSRQGHLENSPPFQRRVTSSPDEGQAPAGAKEVGDHRSAVRENPHDLCTGMRVPQWQSLHEAKGV